MMVCVRTVSLLGCLLGGTPNVASFDLFLVIGIGALITPRYRNYTINSNKPIVSVDYFIQFFHVENSVPPVLNTLKNTGDAKNSMSEETSPLTRLMQTEGFKPFSGPDAFRVLSKAKARLNMEKVEMDDILKAVSSLGFILETETALIYALQDQICTRCGWCCTENTSLRASKDELKRIAEHKKRSYKKLKKSIRARPNKDGTMRVTRHPCPFYEDGCSVYPVRPGVCRSFPTNMILSSLAGDGSYPDKCEISDDLLAELVIKRALEEKMSRENPELMRSIAKKKRDEMSRLSQMPQAQRLQHLISRYRSSLR